jgi:hypothetical protein
MRRVVLIVALALGVWYLVRAEGPIRAVPPVAQVPLGMVFGSSRPVLIREGAPGGRIALVSGDRAFEDGTFGGMWIDPRTGAGIPARVDIRPASGSRAFEAVLRGEHGFRTGVTGWCMLRPVFHLFRIPHEGRGPGFHGVRSCTGLYRVLRSEGARDRVFLTRWLFNSPQAPGPDEILWLDPDREFVACMTRERGPWRLWMFPLSRSPRSDSDR